MVWYVVMTAPQSERKVCQQAVDRGFDAYVPMMRCFKPSDPREVIDRPLMPGYGFVSLDDAAPRFDLFQPDPLQSAVEPIRGCRGFVLFAGSPEPLAASVIDDMRAREARGEFDLTGRTENGRYVIPKWVKPGRAVEFIDGPFKGRVAWICKTISDKIVGVMIEMFGGKVPLNTPIDHIISAR